MIELCLTMHSKGSFDSGLSFYDARPRKGAVCYPRSGAGTPSNMQHEHGQGAAMVSNTFVST